MLKEEPDWERVPAKVWKLIQSCLEKDPKRRLQAIGDWRLLLGERTEGPLQGKARATWITWAVAAVVFALAATALALIHFRETPLQKTVLRYTIAAPDNTSNLHSFAISPGGH